MLLAQTPYADLPSGPEVRSASEVPPSPLVGKEPSFIEITAHSGATGDSDVMIVVADGLETVLAPDLTQLQADLVSEGWSVSLHVMAGGSAEDLRAFLAGQSGLAGAILIGNLPRAWFERDGWGHEEFPLDLFLMDLDGVWTDSDSDGLYDGHTGNRAPEIWVGRIDAHAVEFGNEVQLLQEYLTANHLYRTGSLAAPDRALAFNDDDWSYYGSSGLADIYSTVKVVNNDLQTDADRYLAELETGYEFVHLMAHSSPWGHTFKIPGGFGGTVMAPEISAVGPETVFIQLFSCSNCRWTEPNCLGNWYLFGTDYGLLAIGSTKTGSMLDFQEFYGPIGAGKCPGYAFKVWFTSVGIWDIDWHYGCVLLGDPTLMPLSGRGIHSTAVPGEQVLPDMTFETVSTSQHSDCHPVIAGNSDDIWVAWLTAENGRLDIAAREFSGGSWGNVLTVDADEYWDVTPSLAVDGSGEPWLAWADFDYSTFGYRIKLATGPSFSTVTVAADRDGYDIDPKLAWTDRMWLVRQVWDRGEGDIMVKAMDGSFPDTYLTGTGTWDLSPAAAPDPQGMLHVAWVETGTWGSRIMWSLGNESGFSTPVQVSSGEFCSSPDLVRAGEELLLLWCEDSPSRILIAEWDGSDWETPVVLFTSPGAAAFSPTAGISPSGELFAVWQLGNGAGAEIWQSTRTGAGWSTASLLLDTDGPDWFPALTNGVIAWAGTDAGGDWQIFAERDGGVGIEGSVYSGSPSSFSFLGNPVRESLILSIQNPLEYDAQVTVAVYDISGRRVIDITRTPETDSTLEIRCSALPPGVYCVAASAPGITPWRGMFTIVK